MDLEKGRLWLMMEEEEGIDSHQVPKRSAKFQNQALIMVDQFIFRTSNFVSCT